MEEKIKKILIVDDEPDIINCIKRFFSAKNFVARNATSGEEALRILESETFNIVLLDIMMHGINGDAVARIIKEKYPNTKIIIVTAHPEAGYRVSSNVVIDGVFIKPFCLEDIYAKLTALTT